MNLFKNFLMGFGISFVIGRLVGVRRLLKIFLTVMALLVCIVALWFIIHIGHIILFQL